MHKDRIIMLPLAEEDIARNTDYIAYDMKSPETVLHLLWGFRDVISKLDQNSDKHELDKDMELALYGIRKHYDNKLIENIVIISTRLLIMEVDFCPVLCILEVPVLLAFRGISHFVWYCKAVSDLS